jgi:hypothetical protein
MDKKILDILCELDAEVGNPDSALWEAVTVEDMAVEDLMDMGMTFEDAMAQVIDECREAGRVASFLLFADGFRLSKFA